MTTRIVCKNDERDRDSQARLDAAESLLAYADSLATWEAEWCGPGTAALIREANATADDLFASVGVTRLMLSPVAWERAEANPCQRGTPGCSTDHRPGTDYDCEGW